MFRCKECKTIYKEKVEYCDCGNNQFEEIADIPVSSKQYYPDEDVEVVKKPHLLPMNWLAIGVFSLCCIFALCFVLFMGPEPKKRSKTPAQTEQTQVQNIPSIDKIWDDTPAYGVSKNHISDIDLYKSGLKNALISEFYMSGVDGQGSCDIEFVIDKHGNLKRKKLYQNSANKPLVTAVKSMLSALKKYNPPPKGYEGSIFTLEVSGSGENYQLYYKN